MSAWIARANGRRQRLWEHFLVALSVLLVIVACLILLIGGVFVLGAVMTVVAGLRL